MHRSPGILPGLTCGCPSGSAREVTTGFANRLDGGYPNSATLHWEASSARSASRTTLLLEYTARDWGSRNTKVSSEDSIVLRVILGKSISRKKEMNR